MFGNIHSTACVFICLIELIQLQVIIAYDLHVRKKVLYTRKGMSSIHQRGSKPSKIT